MVPMELVGVQLVAANTPAMMLRESVGEGRMLPILIGSPEAASIQAVLEGLVPPRPLTHDLAVTLLAVLGATLDRVVITEVRDHTFFAELHLRTASGDVVVSARPSDGVALAVRTGAQILAADSVLETAGQPADLDAADEDEDDEELILEEFRDFLDDLDPDDFAT
ncbi:MAG: bifunctional nuclease family protein [Ilumatobacteraceae bacterium]|jgi:bifunctional DNase/RNase